MSQKKEKEIDIEGRKYRERNGRRKRNKEGEGTDENKIEEEDG